MKWKAAGIGMMLTLMAAMPIVCAVDAPVDMKADSIEYDSKKGVLRANGHVVIVQGTAKVQGAHALYNMKALYPLPSAPLHCFYGHRAGTSP